MQQFTDKAFCVHRVYVCSVFCGTLIFYLLQAQQKCVIDNISSVSWCHWVYPQSLSGHSQAEVETLSQTSPASSTTCNTSHPLEHTDLLRPAALSPEWQQQARQTHVKHTCVFKIHCRATYIPTISITDLFIIKMRIKPVPEILWWLTISKGTHTHMHWDR